MSISHKGKKFSSEHIESMRTRAKKHATLDLPECNCMVHNQKHRFNSHLEERMVNLFLNEFPEVVLEKRFGRYTVDAYLPPPYHLAFEADGDYWHSLRTKHDEKRDIWLLKHFQLPVVRLSETEINLAEKQQKEQVRYLSVLQTWRWATTYRKQRMHFIEEDNLDGHLADFTLCGLACVRVPLFAGDRSLMNVPACQKCRNSFNKIHPGKA